MRLRGETEAIEAEVPPSLLGTFLFLTQNLKKGSILKPPMPVL